MLIAGTAYEAYGGLLCIRASNWTILLLSVLALATGACLALLWPDPKRWPESTLESMFQVKGAVSFLFAVGLIGAMALHARVTGHAVVLTLYLIGIAAGYMASGRASLNDVGTFTLAVATCCFLAWWKLAGPPRRVPSGA